MVVVLTDPKTTAVTISVTPDSALSQNQYLEVVSMRINQFGKPLHFR